MSTPPENAPISFFLNGSPLSLPIAPGRRVVDLLREDLQLTGTKEGCGTGECGACTLLVDGLPMLSCLMLAAQLEGRNIETVESLEKDPVGEKLITSFEEKGAVQCGYCIPGMEMTALALLRKHPEADREDIRKGLSGNLCRCTGYVKILDAVEDTAKKLTAPKEMP